MDEDLSVEHARSSWNLQMPLMNTTWTVEFGEDFDAAIPKQLKKMIIGRSSQKPQKTHSLKNLILAISQRAVKNSQRTEPGLAKNNIHTTF